jgi:polysaccharide pyruvyl transferase WcaK-like protein
VRCRAILSAQDLLVIGGGNLLMDLFDGNVRILEAMCDAAVSAGTPFVFLGVGAGPVDREDSRERLAACVAGARSVSLRDDASRILCSEALGRRDAQRMPDPAFALEPIAPGPRRKSLALNVAALGSSAWPWQDERRYGAYIAAFTRMAQAAARRFKPDCVEIVSTNDTVDRCATQEVASALAAGPLAVGCPVSVVACNEVTDALEAFSRAEVAITTRLHAGILASIAGCKVLPVAYDGKVRAVLEGEGIAADAPDPETIAGAGWSPEPLFARVERESASLRTGIAEEVVDAVRDAIGRAP